MKRFYSQASCAEAQDGFALLLDGKAALTPARKPLHFPHKALAEEAAQEWNAQGEEINPALMPLTRLANAVIDRAPHALEEMRRDILNYAACDLVFYRAGEPQSLVEAQNRHWNPVLDYCDDMWGARFILVQGIKFTSQPSKALQAVEQALSCYTSPFRLTAFSLMTNLTGSALITLMHGAGALSLSETWAAAHVDEHHQERLWGIDHEAAQRRENRFKDFEAASKVIKTLPG